MDKKDYATKNWISLLEELGIKTCTIDGLALDIPSTLRKLQTLYPAFKSPIRRVSVWFSHTNPNSLGAMELLNFVGEEFASQGLRLCGIKRATLFILWLQKFEDTQNYFAFWKQNLTRRQFFDNVITFCRKTTVPPTAIVPSGMVAMQKKLWIDEQDIDQCFFLHTDQDDCFVASYDAITSKLIEKKYRAFDVKNFAREFSTTLDIDWMNVEPYRLMIKGDKIDYLYTTDSIAKPKHWRPVELCCLRKNDVCKDEAVEAKDILVLSDCDLVFSSDESILFAEKTTNNVFKFDIQTKKMTKLSSTLFSAKAFAKSIMAKICDDDFVICSSYSINDRNVDLLFLNVRTFDIYVLENRDVKRSFKQVLCWDTEIFVVAANGIVYKLRNGHELINALKAECESSRAVVAEELGRTTTEYNQVKIVFTDVTSITLL